MPDIVEVVIGSAGGSGVTQTDIDDAITAHTGASDPHPVYLTQAEADARYDTLGAASAVVNGAPGALNTLQELAAALGNDASFATTVTTSIGGKLAKASNLSDLSSVPAARTNLGLGDGATKNVGTTAGTLAAGDDSRFSGKLVASSNLSDIASASAARGNLGLGAASTMSVGTSAGTVAAGDDSRFNSIVPAQWLNTIGATTPFVSEVGTSSIVAIASRFGGGYFQTIGLNNEVVYNVVLSAGTYHIQMLYEAHSVNGIWGFYLDGVSLGVSIDGYNASNIANSKAVTAAFTVATSGKKAFTIRTTGKNGSSSAYYQMWNFIYLVRES